MSFDSDWYDDKNLLVAALEEYGSFAAAASAIGGASASTLQKAWNRHKLPPRDPGKRAKPPENQEALQKLYERVYSH